MGREETLSQIYKYMFEKVRDAAEILDDTITSLADQMITDLNTEEYSQLRSPSNVSTWMFLNISVYFYF